jgi:hypothetical protein
MPIELALYGADVPRVTVFSRSFPCASPASSSCWAGLKSRLYPFIFQGGHNLVMLCAPNELFSGPRGLGLYPPKGKARRRRRRRPCPPQAFAGGFALAGVRGTRFGSFPGPGGAAHSADPRAAELARPQAGPGGTGLSLPC